MGRPYPIAKNLKGYLEASGFENIQVTSKRQFCGPWSKDPIEKRIGWFGLMCFETALEAYGMLPLTHGLGKTEDEARGIVAAAWESIKNRSNHMYTYL